MKVDLKAVGDVRDIMKLIIKTESKMRKADELSSVALYFYQRELLNSQNTT